MRKSALVTCLAGGVTKAGYSYGVILGNILRYPECIQACQAEPKCVAASYTINDQPSTDPAAATLRANTCNMLSAVTQKSGDTNWNTWHK